MRSYPTSNFKNFFHIITEFQIACDLEMREVEACMLLGLKSHLGLLDSLRIGRQPSSCLEPEVLNFHFKYKKKF